MIRLNAFLASVAMLFVAGQVHSTGPCGQFVAKLPNVQPALCESARLLPSGARSVRGEPIYVSCVPWHDRVGTIRNVRFRNILARSENGVYINGHEPGAITGVLLDGIRVELSPPRRFPGGEYDRRPSESGPEFTSALTSGFHLDTVTDVTLRQCEVTWAAVDQTSGYAVEARSVEGLRIDDLVGGSAHPDRLPTTLVH